MFSRVISRVSRSLARTQSRAFTKVANEKMPFYALGVSVGQNVGAQFKHLLNAEEVKAVTAGIADELSNTVEDKKELNEHIQSLNKLLSERNEQHKAETKKAGEDFTASFLAENPTAVKTDSGLVYLSVGEGEGAQPTAADTVEVHYHGTLIDGTVFDSSVVRGQTISFALGQVIPGWQEGLALMKEGGKANLVIPSDLAYGEKGSGEIGPGATLKFEVELFKVTPPSDGHGHSHGGEPCNHNH